MTQAEIAGGTLTAANELPSVGRRMNDFELSSIPGSTIALSDYRGRTNLVLFAAGHDESTRMLLVRLADQYAQIVHMLEFVNSQCPECGVPEWPV
jgi:peroxiredoxin